jgi:hypothetical protein
MDENMIGKAIEAIEAQQAKLDKYHPAHMVGEQLKDIVRTTPSAAELVSVDLTQSGMGLTDCEKKIEAFAHSHKVGNHGCCPPDEAEKIIREFYGIGGQPGQIAPLEEPKTSGVLNLFDFI